MSSKKTYAILTALLLALAPMAHAQFYNGMNMPFGKNRVQWNDFHWSYYTNDSFDVYFYQGGNDLAKYAQAYAKDQIPRLELRLNSRFGKKIQFIVFNSMGDFKQSNINLDEEENGNTGGITNIIGSKVILYFDGDYTHYEAQIREGITRLLFSQVMNGISVGSQIRSSYRYDIPQWFQDGLVAYIAGNWDSHKEAQLQRGITSGNYKKINHLRDNDALIAGYSFWNFIDEQYGSKAFNDILTLAENSQNVRKALLYVTGKEYKALIKEWFAFYKSRYESLMTSVPNDVMKLKYKKYRTFTQPSISPNGKFIAYVSNDEGKIRLWLEDLQSGKRQQLFSAGYHSDENIDTSFPLLAWHPNGEILSFIIEEKGKIQLYNLDVNSGKKANTYLFDFQKVSSFSYAHKSRKIVLAATRMGKPDIYVYNLFSNTLEQITNDWHTDLDPVFTYDDRQIVFSSNRNNDTLKADDEIGFQNKQFDLFGYNNINKGVVLQNLTQQRFSNNVRPEPLKDGSMLYLNDTSGYYNLYQIRFDSAISHIDTIVHYRYFGKKEQLTDYSANIIDYSYQPRDHKVAMLMAEKNGEKFFMSGILRGRDEIINQMSPYAQKRLIEELKEEKKDTLAEPISKHRFSASYRFSRRKQQINGPLGGDSVQYVQQGQGAAPKPRPKDTIQRPNNYYVELFADQLMSQIDFTSMNYSYQPFTGGNAPIYLNSGFNVFLGTKLKDLMEDYTIELGVKLNTSLTNNEYMLRFSDYSKRLDKSITLHRYVTDNYVSYYYRTFTNEAFYTLSYPFSEILSLKGTAIYRNDQIVNLAIDDHSLADKDVFENWGGVRGELVYDNSKKIGTNLLVGARGKVFAEYHQKIAKNTANMIVAGFDYRHYTRISRNFIWANHIAGSTSFGQRKLIYYMGGVDNWILASFDQGAPIDYTQNYAYQTLATNMRGFSQNIRNGNNFVVLNSELRFPVFSYFMNRPINRKFIRDFQIVAFGDLGTAWTGWNPYDPSNSLYNTHISDGNLNITVTEMKEPLVGGVGFGLRTTIFGYFVRGDVAWGIQDGQIAKKPRYYLSFNLDF
ncbi:MAG: PD40 domain-containing protein [Bacteroidales bacterium]|nr:PD40 domain-containing protein [Bacteroidales bacterium]